ncbi:MAG: hypothetical protein H9W80_10895, partial [Enterococcus sp.]|nr:hypothetical protein [Enterococcus sp.]
VVDPELPVFATNRSTFDFNGIGTWAGKDTHFAQLKYNGDHTATLKEGVEMYGCSIHPCFEDIYASILAKDKDGNTLFTKEFKGTDYVQAKEENFSLPEGATLTLYHAEGTSGRYETSNAKELKQHPGTIYHYVVHDNKLIQTDASAQRNSIRLNLKENGSYVYVENGYLTANNANVKPCIDVTKNGQKVTLDSNNNFTELKVGDTFTIQPISSTWKDEPVTSRQSLGTFDGSNKYTFKVNDDGFISLVATEEASACDNIYRISSVCDQTKCLDNNANNKDLFVWSKVEQAENHYFNFHFIKDDIVKISSKDNTRWLTTNGQIGSTITQTNNEQEASYWKIKQLGNNKVALHYMGNKKVGIDDSNLSLNICGGNVTDGTKVILYPSSYDNYMNQQFILN